MNKIPVNNIFAAVFEKSLIDPLLAVLDKKSVKFWGTEGTVKYLVSKGFSAKSVVTGFDFDGRVKSLDRVNFVRILADRTKKRHMDALKNLITYSSSERSESRSYLSTTRHPELDSGSMVSSRQARTIRNDGWQPFDLVIVDLYAPDKKNFPESMDIGGQALIRAAIKNYKNVALAFDEKSINDAVVEIKKNHGLTTLLFRKKQVKKALKFITERGKLEFNYFK